MSEPFVGEIRMFAGTFAPVGWALCDGQTLTVQDNQILFALIGTIYGGDGATTFRLPDMRGRVPISLGSSLGNNYVLGQQAGTETVTLTLAQLPAHTHLPNAQSAAGEQAQPAGAVWSAKQVFDKPAAGAALVGMNPKAIEVTGSSLPHENMMPFMTLSFIIATDGFYPSQG